MTIVSHIHTCVTIESHIPHIPADGGDVTIESRDNSITHSHRCDNRVTYSTSHIHTYVTKESHIPRILQAEEM